MDKNHSMFSTERVYGLELQEPFSELVLNGKKTIETRSYELPSSLLYRHILIIESKNGDAGVGLSNVCKNNMNLHYDKEEENQEYPRIVGSVVFGSCFEYHTERMWAEDEEKTCVPFDSFYAWPRVRMNSDRRRLLDSMMPEQEEEKKERNKEEEVHNGLSIDEDQFPEHIRALRQERLQKRLEQWKISKKVEMGLKHQDARLRSGARRANVNEEKASVEVVKGGEEGNNNNNEKMRELSPGDVDGDGDGGIEEEQEKEEEDPSLRVRDPHCNEKDRRYGWKVLGVFRAPVMNSLVPKMVRVHRSLFDCGPADLLEELPHF